MKTKSKTIAILAAVGFALSSTVYAAKGGDHGGNNGHGGHGGGHSAGASSVGGGSSSGGSSSGGSGSSGQGQGGPGNGQSGDPTTAGNSDNVGHISEGIGKGHDFHHESAGKGLARGHKHHHGGSSSSGGGGLGNANGFGAGNINEERDRIDEYDFDRGTQNEINGRGGELP